MTELSMQVFNYEAFRQTALCAHLPDTINAHNKNLHYKSLSCTLLLRWPADTWPYLSAQQGFLAV